MKSGSDRGRTYRMTARAEKAARTADRILDAALPRFATLDFDEVTLASIAEDAGVTVQTVIRRFGGKDGLFSALVAREAPRIDAERTPPGGASASLAEAVRALVDHYESDGRGILNFLKQESRSEPLAEVVRTGRAVHDEWVRTYCKGILAGARGPARKRRFAAAVAATDLYVWKVLRLDRDLGRAEVERTMLLLLEGLRDGKGE